MSVNVPARDDAAELPELARGSRFVAKLPELGVPIPERSVADLGAGYGSIALAAARAGARRVVALDASRERLALVAERARAQGVEVETLEANLLDPPNELPGVDLALLSGVVEYAGLWDRHAPVEELQQRIFKTAFNLLDPGGTLLFASKNRLWPRFLIRDAHTHLPLVNNLPRRFADRLTRVVSGRPYRHHIHSPAGWVRLIRAAGFRSTELYYPYFSYQFPVAITRKPSFGIVSSLPGRSTSDAETRVAFGPLWLPKAVLMGLGSLIGVPLTQSVIVKATK